MNFEIYPMTEENYKAVAKLAKENLAEAWSEGTFFSQLSNSQDLCLTAYCNDVLVGFLDVWYVVDEIDINNIAVDKDYRKNGIAFALISEMENNFPNAYCCNLEVRKSNEKAILLYKKCGFENVGERKNFYTTPVENAVIMKKIYTEN